MRPWCPGCFVLLLMMAALCQNLLALPEYQMRYLQSCGLCHFNPTGGGMRTLYGAQFVSYTDLPMKTLSLEDIEKVKPRINEDLQVGLDLRGLYYAQNDLKKNDSARPSLDDNRFVLMQASLYLAYTLTERATVCLDFSNFGLEEAYALFQGLPMTGVVRVGKFMPSYGWRFADHKLFVRQFLDYGGLQGPGTKAYDTGVEIGAYPQGWDMTLGLINGTAATQGKAILGRVAKRATIASVNASLGASYRAEDIGDWRHSPQFYGAFYGLYWNRWTFLGETDVLDESVNGLVATHQLRWMATRGWYWNIYYQYFDPDVKHQTGYQWSTRLSSDILPRGYFSLSPAIEWDHDSGGYEYGTAEVQVHLWL
jgi:hypothetical protein